MNYQLAMHLVQEKLSEGASPAAIVPALKAHGVDIITSIKLLREVAGIPLGEAKQTVASHDVWKEVSNNMDTIHAELVDLLEATVKS